MQGSVYRGWDPCSHHTHIYTRFVPSSAKVLDASTMRQTLASSVSRGVHTVPIYICAGLIHENSYATFGDWSALLDTCMIRSRYVPDTTATSKLAESGQPDIVSDNADTRYTQGREAHQAQPSIRCGLTVASSVIRVDTSLIQV